MSHFGPFDLSGEGIIDFGSEQTIVGVVLQLTTSADVQFVSETFPRRLMHAGWMAGTTSSDAGPVVRQFGYLLFELQDWAAFVPAESFPIITQKLLYHWSLGVHVQADIYT